jgi:hypothetical protein
MAGDDSRLSPQQSEAEIVHDLTASSDQNDPSRYAVIEGKGVTESGGSF